MMNAIKVSSTQQQMVVASSESDSSAPSWVVVELDLHVNNVNDSLLPLGSRNSEQQHQHKKLEPAGSGGGGELTELFEHASRSKKRLFPCGEEEKLSRVKGPNECEACGGNIVSMGCDGDDTDDIVQHFRYSTSSSHHEARFLALLQNYTWEYNNEVRKLRVKPTVVKNGVAAAA